MIRSQTVANTMLTKTTMITKQLVFGISVFVIVVSFVNVVLKSLSRDANNYERNPSKPD
jgi:hypothetical protein